MRITKRKFIGTNVIGGAQFRLDNDQILRARNSLNDADVSLFKLDTNNFLQFLSEPQYAGVPSNGNALVNRDYVLDVLAGIRDPKDACELGTVGNIDIASAPATIDGQAPSIGARILVKNQTNGAENGIRIWTAEGAPMLRSSDADSDEEVTSGMSTVITSGNTNARKAYVLTTVDPIVLNTTPLSFAQVPNPANFLVPVREKFVVDATILTNGYIDLLNTALSASIQLFYEGLAQTEDDDFDLSVESGVTRITFDGDMEVGGPAAIETGDKITVHYSYETV